MPEKAIEAGLLVTSLGITVFRKRRIPDRLVFQGSSGRALYDDIFHCFLYQNITIRFVVAASAEPRFELAQYFYSTLIPLPPCSLQPVVA